MSKLPSGMLERIGLILSTLHATQTIEGMEAPAFRLHALKGELKGLFPVTVRANWRIVFRFQDGDPLNVDFIDCH